MDGRHIGSRGVVDGDGNALQVLEIELQRIAHYLPAGRNGSLVAVAELEVLGRFGINLEGVFGVGDIDGAYHYGLHRVDIAQFQSYHVASHAYFYYLANRTVCHVVIIGHKRFHHSLRCRSPSSNPCLCRHL